ncbi:MAG: hypothetical protein QOD75_1132 [Blastocatellia bacterium]|jgi:transcriptional regulator with GAF, ATPase, and Fis domain|nr:hypothetical protein [Blastocatellia bacterium]
MNSTIWESDDAELINDPGQAQTQGISSAGESEAMAGHRIDGLRQLTMQLFREVQSISDVESVKVESGVDYYEEVRRFEVDMIMRALMQTAGHQRRAARLLNLKVTTLNSKIKLFNIKIDDAVRMPPAGGAEPATRPHA